MESALAEAIASFAVTMVQGTAAATTAAISG